MGPGPDGFGEYHDNALELADGRRPPHPRLAVHGRASSTNDAMFGHSAIDYAVELARRAEAKRLMLFHHDPPRTDDQLDAIVASLADAGVPVSAAAEGVELSTYPPSP